jgi:DNA modification methylase
MGAGTTALVATELGRYYIGIEIGEKYIEMSRRRLERIKLPLTPVEI